MSQRTRLIVIIGITGNQGGSVANAFLRDAQWRIRGLTRDANSSASQSLAAKGVEMVTADLHDPSSLEHAFDGANLVFSVTDFWMPYLDPKNQARAKKLGKSIGRYAYELEYEQGKNIADAVARVADGLDEVGFIASTLSNARKCSKGKYQELYHFDSKADIFPDYLQVRHPELAKKTSYLHTGLVEPARGLAVMNIIERLQLPDGSIQMQFPTRPDTVIPRLDPRKDTGQFVRALLRLPPGKTVMAAGTWCTWAEWVRTFGEVTGAKTSYREVSVSDFDEWLPGGIGKEIGDMYEYSSDPGYDGGDPSVLRITDLEKMGITMPLTNLHDYIRQEDWATARMLPFD